MLGAAPEVQAMEALFSVQNCARRSLLRCRSLAAESSTWQGDCLDFQPALDFSQYVSKRLHSGGRDALSIMLVSRMRRQMRMVRRVVPPCDQRIGWC